LTTYLKPIGGAVSPYPSELSLPAPHTVAKYELVVKKSNKILGVNLTWGSMPLLKNYNPDMLEKVPEEYVS
jgi:hypothetical protein